MPSKSAAQARLMAAAAHTPGGFGGVPQKVGKDFNQADKGKRFPTQHVANAIRKGKKHKEPDVDERGGKSDMDADNGY